MANEQEIEELICDWLASETEVPLHEWANDSFAEHTEYLRGFNDGFERAERRVMESINSQMQGGLSEAELGAHLDAFERETNRS